tara:strand:+ start:106 stop:348 length:243 start_codon:yes stop_codon:yes gene_type:complete
MFNDGISNEFEEAHQKGLTRGFDLGWSYKGRFDRQIIRDEINKLQKSKRPNKSAIQALQGVLANMVKHPNNKENITFNSW